ncbi:MAG: hypothetical protein Q8Q09_10435 [Deltaproteobacteria bacterium]|nr:hypothetical protein [Deltaproteobacteria bacterium]
MDHTLTQSPLARALLPHAQHTVGALALLMGLVGCRKPVTPTAVAPDAVSAPSVDAGQSPDSGAAEAMDAASAETSAVAAVLTVRIINEASRAVPLYTNPDLNEMIHTRKLRSRRHAQDGGRDSDPIKLFPVGQMPLCSEDGGAGYGGLGQPERRELAPGETLDFVWDGLERRERLDPARGVCLDEAPPNPGRYRFELDQPHRTLRCTDPEFSWPLREGAPRVIEIRCRLRTSADDHREREE